MAVVFTFVLVFDISNQVWLLTSEKLSSAIMLRFLTNLTGWLQVTKETVGAQEQRNPFDQNASTKKENLNCLNTNTYPQDGAPHTNTNTKNQSRKNQMQRQMQIQRKKM